MVKCCIKLHITGFVDVICALQLALHQFSSRLEYSLYIHNMHLTPATPGTTIIIFLLNRMINTLRIMLNDSINLLNFSCSGNCDVPVAAIVGGGFILAGCVMIMIVLCIFRYTGRLNDEYAIKERLRRDVSST